ncbi:MAG TPA: hypothetical protein VL972_03900 [Solirubrobacteraceae bacterium]|nr:hypothetical protein [Solirubrobacteraceae bacterium]
MIVLGIAGTWLTLTAAGFAGLSAFGRGAAHEGCARESAGRTAHEPLTGASGEPAPSVADMRSLIARALL